ncbi:hypothetical protein KL86PLE_40984 [uncultured Pleomorphomonas sp.]|uniref:Uncharacterized protein n=1 Tax=uncultured Pleomorphomonas sp. TaxID=442121 RepID=A0A212LII1_9HYPH|nr:hypothetical protein KL86PLE_40984 [uncultured Pleomorphomonas sp.]
MSWFTCGQVGKTAPCRARGHPTVMLHFPASRFCWPGACRRDPGRHTYLPRSGGKEATWY